MTRLTDSNAPSEMMRTALHRCRPHLASAAAFSAAINLLYLTPTIFMMQVYDRVLSSGNIPTLIALGAACMGGLATLSLLDWVRGRLLVRATMKIDESLATTIVDATLSQPALSRHNRSEALRQFDTFRHALGGGAIIAIMDAPWTLIYLLVAFLLHPALGFLTLIGGVTLVLLAWSNERATHKIITRANEASSLAYAHQSQVSAYAAEVRSLGMRKAMTQRQLDDRAVVNELQLQASLVNGSHAGLIKFARLALQSLALGLGGYLVLQGSMSGGAIFAASLLLTKAVQPVEQIVGAWKGLLLAREAYYATDRILAAVETHPRTRLPQLTGQVEVERLVMLTPMVGRVAIAGISFQISPGELVGIAGQSGAGKSTLLRALAGAAEPKSGTVRFDGSAYADWDSEQISQQIGYLPQDFALFPGTVKDNIARFSTIFAADASTVDARVIEAAQLVGVHDMIVRLPEGYQTTIGLGGVGLSAGQTQRIALARAMFGNPKVLIFDEPNAHLDSEAEAALLRLFADQKSKGVTLIIAAHSDKLLESADKLLMLENGQIARIGTRKVERSNLQSVNNDEKVA